MKYCVYGGDVWGRVVCSGSMYGGVYGDVYVCTGCVWRGCMRTCMYFQVMCMGMCMYLQVLCVDGVYGDVYVCIGSVYGRGLWERVCMYRLCVWKEFMGTCMYLQVL